MKKMKTKNFRPSADAWLAFTEFYRVLPSFFFYRVWKFDSAHPAAMLFFSCVSSMSLFVLVVVVAVVVAVVVFVVVVVVVVVVVASSPEGGRW